MTEILKEKIMTIKGERNHRVADLEDKNQRFMELFRVDVLIREMNFFEAKDSLLSSEALDNSLTKFVLAYRGSSKLIYGEGAVQPYSRLFEEMREKMKINQTLSEQNISRLSHVFSSKFEHFSQIEGVQNNIQKLESELAGLGGRATSASNLQEKDDEALAVLSKLNEKYKDKYKGYKINGLSLAGETLFLTLSHPKKGNVSLQPNLASLKPLNNKEGIERLNGSLSEKAVDAKKKEATKANNKELKEKQTSLLEKIEKEKKNLENLKKDLGKEVEKYFKNLSDKEMLDMFSIKNDPLKAILETNFNQAEIKKTLISSFKGEKQIWQYVKEYNYYDKVKDVVLKGVDKSSKLLQSASPELKDLIEIREIELKTMKNLGPNSEKEMNDALAEYGYKIRLQEIKIEEGEKSGEYAGKNPSQISEILLKKATDRGENQERRISPYQRKYMALGLMYGLGEGMGKNDETELFRQYMKIYFGEEKIQVVDIPQMQKKYAWEEFKKANEKKSKEIYEDIRQNAENPIELKTALSEGMWTGGDENSIHHLIPRRYGICFKNPDLLNNQSNLVVTTQWKGWKKDNHQMEHFFGMSQYEGVGNFLTKKNGELVREDLLKNLSEVYYEKPQTSDGKDLIPENTLYISSNITVEAPTISEKVKHLLLEEFKPVVESSEKEPRKKTKIYTMINYPLKELA